jgi:hypothetical protein
MFGLYAPLFAVAGLAAASAPIVIHLLNRRRFRTLDWAAMEFLRAAVNRSRKAVQLRDLLLLLLRTAAILLLGLAFARPYWGAAQGLGADQPVHLLLVLDNSLSMRVRELNGTLLDAAKSRADALLAGLPSGSRVSVLPTCRTPRVLAVDPYRNLDDARDAVQSIDAVDQPASLPEVVAAVRSACERDPELTARRLVFIGDHQKRNFSAGEIAADIPGVAAWELLQVRPQLTDNTTVAAVQLRDVVAAPGRETVVSARVQHSGSAPRRSVEVRLTVAGRDVASQTVDLEPGQNRELVFRTVLDSSDSVAGHVPVSVSLTPDSLPEDDVRHLAVPVLEKLPVLFVDQFGRDENPRANRLGETWPMRVLLGGDEETPLHAIRLTDLTRERAREARLIVVSGVDAPDPSAVDLLREFVEQGGELVLTAGGRFDPEAWTKTAWRDGAGILPLPLAREPVGVLPSAKNARLNPFFLNPDTFSTAAFSLPEASGDEFADLLRGPLFFMAVDAQSSESILDALHAATVAAAREAAAERKSNPAAARGFNPAATHGSNPDVEGVGWLTWSQDRFENSSNNSPANSPANSSTDPSTDSRTNSSTNSPAASSTASSTALAALADRQQPRVLASYTNGKPFLVERAIGRGHVLLMTSGVGSEWNTIARGNAVVMFDQWLRTRLGRTLPPRTVAAVTPLTLPVSAGQRRLSFSIRGPDGRDEPLAVDALGSERYGLVLRGLYHRGLYTVSAFEEPNEADRIDRATGRPAAVVEPAKPVSQTLLAVNGPEEESDLAPADAADAAAAFSNTRVVWSSGTLADAEGLNVGVGAGELWPTALFTALLCLLAELLILARSDLIRGASPVESAP